MAISQDKKQQRREARALLEGFWPEVFRFNAPLPLKEGIFRELVVDAERRGLPFDAAILKKAMKTYTCRYAYQQAIVTKSERIDLEGSPVGIVTQEQRDYAKIQIQRINAKTRKNAQKRAADAQNVTKTAEGETDA